MWQSDHYYVGSGHGLPHHLCAVKNSVFWNHISCIFLALQWHNEHETPRSNRGNFIFLISSLSDCAALSGNVRRETDSSDSRRGPPWTRVCDASFQPCRKHEAFQPEHSRHPGTHGDYLVGPSVPSQHCGRKIDKESSLDAKGHVFSECSWTNQRGVRGVHVKRLKTFCSCGKYLRRSFIQGKLSMHLNLHCS